MKSVDVTISGAGLVGPLVALVLSKRGKRVRLIEGRPDPRLVGSATGRSINLTLSTRAWRTLAAVGLEEVVRAIAIPLQGRRIHLEQGERFQPYGASGEAIYSVMRGRLHTALLDAVSKDPNLTIQFGQRCVEIDTERGIAHIEDQQSGARWKIEDAPILVADGAASTLVTRREPMSIGYKEVRIPVQPDGRWPFDPHSLHLWPRGDYFFAAFPNLDRSFTCSLFLPHAGPVSFETLKTPADVRALFSEVAPDLAAVAMLDDYAARAPSKLYTVQCAQWAFGDRVLLLGDAAHAIVPFLGQGLNASCEDVAILDQCLDECGGEWGPSFAAFERRRKDDICALADLAVRHFHEISASVRGPEWVMRKRLEQKLYELSPTTFVPFYTGVSFTNMPYRSVAARAVANDAVLDALLKIPDVEQRWDEPGVRDRVHSLLPKGLS
ncbi:MAG: NAD(P)/FAD-dependent oxidoreductase [Kofleriaceae bacterium]